MKVLILMTCFILCALLDTGLAEDSVTIPEDLLDIGLEDQDVLATSQLAQAECTQDTLTTPLYRYWRSSVSDHFYTTDPNEIGTTTPGKVGKYGYKSEGIVCTIYKYSVKNSTPLYRYWKGSVSDHFYTTNPTEIGTTLPGRTGKHGYVSEGITGFCMPKQTAETIPLYRYWKSKVSDHFYTTNINEIGTATPGAVGNHGYKSEGIQCYVLPA